MGETIRYYYKFGYGENAFSKGRYILKERQRERTLKRKEAMLEIKQHVRNEMMDFKIAELHQRLKERKLDQIIIHSFDFVHENEIIEYIEDYLLEVIA